MTTNKVQGVSFKVEGDNSSEGGPSGVGKKSPSMDAVTTMKPETCQASPTSSSPTSSSPTSSSQPASSAVAAKQHLLRSKVRDLLLSYLKFVSTPARQEAILKTTQYSLWLLSRYYAARGAAAARRRAAAAGGSEGVRVPNDDSSSSSSAALLAESLVSLAGEISWTRYLLRCFGLPAALEGVESGSWAPGSTRLGRAMAGTMVAYYPLENLAYLLWRAPRLPVGRWLPAWAVGPTRTTTTTKTLTTTTTTGPPHGVAWDPSRFAARASAWSCRFWLAFIVLDVVRSMTALRELQSPAADGEGEGDDDGTAAAAAAAPHKHTAAIRTERLQVVRDVLYMVQAIQWSLPNWDTQPWLPVDVVNGICWLESLVGMYQTVCNFQEA